MPTSNFSQSQLYLAFDFGMRRIGVAIGQSITQTARPLQVIPAKQGVPNWDEINRLIKRWQPHALIVGIPLNMDGSEQTIGHHARAFGQALHARYQIPVYEAEERLTTKAARESLFNEGGYSALQGGQVDCVAAQLILENWFKANKSSF